MEKILFTADMATVLTLAGFVKTTVPAEWEDVGGPESGPEVSGHDEYDAWVKGDTVVYVQDGYVCAIEKFQPDFKDIPN